MFERIKKLFKKEDVIIDKEVERELKKLDIKLVEGSERTVAKFDRMKDDVDECAEGCQMCGAKGYLKKDIRLLYPCRECYGEGQLFWIDRCLTASKVNEYERRLHERICSNIHTLMYELKQEALKINAVALIEIKPVESNTAVKNFVSMNWYGGKIVDDENN